MCGSCRSPCPVCGGSPHDRRAEQYCDLSVCISACRLLGITSRNASVRTQPWQSPTKPDSSVFWAALTRPHVVASFFMGRAPCLSVSALARAQVINTNQQGTLLRSVAVCSARCHRTHTTRIACPRATVAPQAAAALTRHMHRVRWLATAEAPSRGLVQACRLPFQRLLIPKLPLPSPAQVLALQLGSGGRLVALAGTPHVQRLLCMRQHVRGLLGRSTGRELAGAARGPGRACSSKATVPLACTVPPPLHVGRGEPRRWASFKSRPP